MKLRASCGDLILGGCSIVTGIVILFLTQLQGLPFLKKDMPGPGMFPVLCAIAIITCGILLMVQAAHQMQKEKNSTQEDAGGTNLVNAYELRNLLILMIMGVLILVLSAYIGLLTSLCLSMIAYIKIQGKDPLWKAAAIGVGATVFLYIVFVWFLHVPVPTGPLGF